MILTFATNAEKQLKFRATKFSEKKEIDDNYGFTKNKVLEITRQPVYLRFDIFLRSQFPKADMNLIPVAVTKSIMRTLRKALRWLGINNLGPQRPFMSLFVGAFLMVGFLPLLTYLVFASVAVSLGVFLLIVIDGGILTVATVTLMVALILPACIAGGFALFVYTIFSAFSQMKGLVESAVNVPQKLVRGDGSTNEGKGELLDEKPGFQGKARFRPGRKSSHDAGKDSDCEADDASDTRSTLVPGGVHENARNRPISA